MQLESLEKQLDVLIQIIKISLQLSIGVGALIILIYCGGIGYYPSGLTAGDGLVFIAAALSFGFFYSIIVLFLFCTAIVLTPFWRVAQLIIARTYTLLSITKKRTRKEDDLQFPPLTSDQLGVTAIGLFGVVLIAISFLKDIELFVGLTASVALMALCYLLMISMKKNQDDSEQQGNTNNRVKLAFALSIYLIPLVIGRFQGNVLEQTMRAIGARTDSAVVRFRDDYKDFVDASLGNNAVNLYEARILFNGFGTNSVIEIEGKRFVVPNSQYFLHYD